MKSIIYVGMDVHKDSHSLCAYNLINDSLFAEVKVPSDYKNIVHYIDTLKKQYHDDAFDFICGYEAGSLGYSLYHRLTDAGLHCVIIAPSTIAKSSKDKKRKNDRMDARLLAKTLAFGSYKSVHIPTKEDHDTKEYTRMRDFYKDSLKRNKQAINSFLLRNGIQYDKGSKWTITHLTWLRSLKLNGILQITLDEYIDQFDRLSEKLERLDDKIVALSNSETYAAKTSLTKCFKGISDVTALIIQVEIGDFDRFEEASSVCAYLGMIPGLHDSSEKTSNMHITKQGNARVRTLLVEAAQNLVKGKPGMKSKRTRAKQKGQEADVIRYADRAVERLQKRYHKMINRGVKHSVAIMAVARELACFIWGIQTNHIEGRS